MKTMLKWLVIVLVAAITAVLVMRSMPVVVVYRDVEVNQSAEFHPVNEVKVIQGNPVPVVAPPPQVTNTPYFYVVPESVKDPLLVSPKETAIGVDSIRIIYPQTK